MSSRLYRDHFIRAFPSFDTATNGWAPQADVSWGYASTIRKFAFLKFAQRCMTEEEAISCALDMAQRWIDRRATHPNKQIGGAKPGQVIDMMRSLQKHRAKETFKEPHPQTPAERRLEKILTFTEFKSAIAQSGLRINEHTLQKSYTALDRLRTKKHLSWSATRRKLQHLQEDFKAARSPARHLKAARIPLTDSDWDRIG
jgi:hypothetical protein